jgi:hypothetical protein
MSHRRGGSSRWSDDAVTVSGAAGDECGDDVAGVAVKVVPGAVLAGGRARVGVPGGIWTSRSGTPASKAAVMNECGNIDLVIPAFLARRRTILVAAWRLRRNPDWARRSGPDRRSPAARSTARATRGGRGMRASFDPFAQHGHRPMAPFDGEVFDGRSRTPPRPARPLRAIWARGPGQR